MPLAVTDHEDPSPELLNSLLSANHHFPTTITFKKMPIIKSVNHTGITVVDIERSVSFWVDVMGCKLVSRTNPKGPGAGALTGLNTDTDILIAMLEAPGGHQIELLQYIQPSNVQHYKPKPCDAGTFHLAVNVDSIEESKKAMIEAGCVCHGEAHTFSGISFLYLHDFDGVAIELVQGPSD
ncbi:Glyoxalase/Bleomycin resistance protein/Dihydroxybiphenyl dioxygenase [Dendrothele bispora CBS 962.96]|uniref:Glyoxalase/Bleomycin resistance protein/Dihydroxybiphenyl dioxygenase n=1 Tax=Dendrothele bispora (strain CBS 962.96) TaxID=1314807 RepID=A0A4V4HG78_DENBC|nr:Glyoxalase/Bleomycin resistance protein/Dihydroxybiphenyl dioxygenase [Dendrothele bispora CBS 962.96]